MCIRDRISHHNRFALTKVIGFIKDGEVDEDLCKDSLFDIYEYELLDSLIEEEGIEPVYYTHLCLINN